MIYVTVGNDYRGFNRLLSKIDEIAPRVPTDILIQRGYSSFSPEHAPFFDFVPMERAMEYLRTSELVVSHAGIGTIILCKEYGTPLVILPRRKKYREHMNDHQLEVAEALERRKGENIYVAKGEEELEEKIFEALNSNKPSPTPSTGRMNLIRTIKEFVETSAP